MSKKLPLNLFAGESSRLGLTEERPQPSAAARSSGRAQASKKEAKNSFSTPEPKKQAPAHPPPLPPPGPSSSTPSGPIASIDDSLAITISMMCSGDAPRVESLRSHLLGLLLSESPSDALQSDLIDALGFENIELVAQICQNRDQALSALLEMDSGIREEESNSFSGLVPVQPVQSRQVQVAKKNQSKRKYQMKTTLQDADQLEYELAARDAAQRAQSIIARRYPFVFDAGEMDSLQDGKPLPRINVILPERAIHIKEKLYDEIFLPPSDNQANPEDYRKVNIADLDPVGKLGFEGFKRLNTIQSIVFEQAYNTVENLLICAPTGAGKTNIAMLAVLKTIRDNCRSDGTIDKNAFKIIYIAPMKALAAEMTITFGKRLKPLGITVRELTGDTTMSKREISETQMLILTPEKWDVVTRKADDDDLTGLVRLLIIDEVHLLHDERGPVIETIVARTLRRIHMSQHKVRIVGLSATLPNFVDVATFLGVNPEKGLFFFDRRFRPVPLAQSFIGVAENDGCGNSGPRIINQHLDIVAYMKALEFAREGHQVLVFVHTRSGTSKVIEAFLEFASRDGELETFMVPNNTTRAYIQAKKQISNIRCAPVEKYFLNGFGIHHAGMPRPHRSLIERLFAEGHIRVLACTATLAWGVNLPAHAVIIRGTEIFDPQKGVFTDIGALDVQQIFGRAGRPQYETSGFGIILTGASKLRKYVKMLLQQVPIESAFMNRIHDNLNAEVAAGTVSTIEEAVEWLRYTYFYVRARLNPLAYGLTVGEVRGDPSLEKYLTDLCYHTAKRLDQNRMISFDSINGYLSATDLGRIASHFYVTYATIENVNSNEGIVKFTQNTSSEIALAMICKAQEFAQISARETEMDNLSMLSATSSIFHNANGSLVDTEGKVNVLLQAYISRTNVENFALFTEMVYVSQNASRIARAYFEIILRRGWASLANTCLMLSKCVAQRMWEHQTPLRQLGDYLRYTTINKVEGKRLSFHQFLDFSADELGSMFSVDGHKLYSAFRFLPVLDADATIRPITGSIVQIDATITPAFNWNDRMHGTGTMRYWILIEDVDEDLIVHYEPLIVQKKKVVKQQSQRLLFTLPVRDDQVMHQFQLRIANDTWIVEDTIVPISLHGFRMPEEMSPHTDLLELDPLPVTSLKNKKYQSLYNFEFFNPIQTQVFHCLYHSDKSSLIGAPTSSGKTLCAELAIFRCLSQTPDRKCVYIAPLKALVRERVLDWGVKFQKNLGIRIVEVSGDHTPDADELSKAQVLVTTPEKWDGITRAWESRSYVRQVGLVVIDEIHLLGVERGAVLEAIVTRIKLIARKRPSDSPIRIVGLSTALANAADIAKWLDIPASGLYNFRPAVRPVKIDVHIAGFSEQHYCPRMALMNKPAFKAIKQFSPVKPTLIFVASRRQTRITAMAFLTMLASEDDPRQWLHMDPADLQAEFDVIKDENLRLTLPFGIGMHHAGLQPAERSAVERLFVERKIQVLIATATLAWGINCPAHLVIVKGTEYFDGAKHKYVDFPVTDVLQMIGRAGRPQYDTSAVAVVYVQDVKKNFYKRFLYEPFPVESSLLEVLPNHINAEIASGAIHEKKHVVEYISGTYFYRRLFANPTYYGVDDPTPEGMTKFLTSVVDHAIDELTKSYCVTVDDAESGDGVVPTVYGRIASSYYLEHITLRHFVDRLGPGLAPTELLRILADCPEYAEIPVRHNEEIIQEKLSHLLPLSLNKAQTDFESPHVKVYLLYQAHFSQFKDLQADYVTDLRSILDACIRIFQAMLDVCLANGWLDSAIGTMVLLQQVVQGRWAWDHPLLCLPRIENHAIDGIGPNLSIPQLQAKYGMDKPSYKLTTPEMNRLAKEITSRTILEHWEAKRVVEALAAWPILAVRQPTVIFEDGSEHHLAFNSKTPVTNSVCVLPGQRCKLRLRLDLLGAGRTTKQAYTPRFHKEKTASWIVLIGAKDTNSVIGFSKVSPIVESRHIRLNFVAPVIAGSYKLTVFILSDAYLGIDQEYEFSCNVQAK